MASRRGTLPIAPAKHFIRWGHRSGIPTGGKFRRRTHARRTGVRVRNMPIPSSRSTATKWCPRQNHLFELKTRFLITSAFLLTPHFSLPHPHLLLHALFLSKKVACSPHLILVGGVDGRGPCRSVPRVMCVLSGPKKCWPYKHPFGMVRSRASFFPRCDRYVRYKHYFGMVGSCVSFLAVRWVRRTSTRSWPARGSGCWDLPTWILTPCASAPPSAMTPFSLLGTILTEPNFCFRLSPLLFLNSLFMPCILHQFWCFFPAFPKRTVFLGIMNSVSLPFL